MQALRKPANTGCGVREAEATSPRLFTRWVRNCCVIAPMRKPTKPSPTESPLLFEVDPQPLEETLTALGGIPLVVQTFRSLGLPQSVKEHVGVKERERGYDEATFVESFVVLSAAGGECPEDFKRLRADPIALRTKNDLSVVGREIGRSVIVPAP